MAVNYEIKSQLAKLLATEDLVVEHKDINTAQFNVQTRVLTLPMWDKASNFVYDMLVGHEVGHALYTPNEDPPQDVPHSFINVTEDARIEKLMKRKYAGMSKTFFRGYKELNSEDFFELENVDLNKMNLADKANLYFKIGNFHDIDFNLAERQIIDMISAAETFSDAVDAARVLYEFCKEKKERKKQKHSVLLILPPRMDNRVKMLRRSLLTWVREPLKQRSKIQTKKSLKKFNPVVRLKR